jgi:photosystem II stability/assembly factor-like uncharacterized protein
MIRTMLGRLPILLLLAALAAAPAAAQVWRSMGPPGGDVRSLAADPHDPARIFLGTADGHVFGSADAGESWELLGRAGDRNDGVVMAIRVDPRDAQTLYVASWKMDPEAGGGFYRSRDGGRTWELAGLAGLHVRALAQAPSDPDILVAGTRYGVYRSRDAGTTWKRISPEGHEEIRNLDSVAIDPRDPDIIYAGTYHLPWKTTDGGRRWVSIHQGMIDDSDVFSIEIDRTNPRRIYASACSGIYRSDNAGALWQKIQGIPYSARRTHVIRQDPVRAATVYAGTTEGLWRTTSAGAAWQRLTPRNWVINALVIDPARPERLVVGTDRLGVMVSDDGGKTFRASNRGFHHRQIVSLALDRDPARQGRVLAVLANAPEPLLATEDGGQTWEPLGPGLSTEGLLGVYASPDGWWAALERGGLMRYDEQAGRWVAAGTVTGEAAVVRDRRGYLVPARGPRPLVQRVVDLAFSREAWFAATPQGLLVSRDLGRHWERFAFAPLDLPVSSVRVSPDGRDIRIISLRGMVFSRDGGQTWTWHDLPFGSGGAQRLEVVDDATVLATAHKGLFISRDGGHSWTLAGSGLPAAPVQALAVLGDTFLASMQTGGLYLSTDRGYTWRRVEGLLAEGFFPVVTTDDSATYIFAASSTEGLYSVDLGRPAQVAGAAGAARGEPGPE